MQKHLTAQLPNFSPKKMRWTEFKFNRFNRPIRNALKLSEFRQFPARAAPFFHPQNHSARRPPSRIHPLHQSSDRHFLTAWTSVVDSVFREKQKALKRPRALQTAPWAALFGNSSRNTLAITSNRMKRLPQLRPIKSMSCMS